MKKLILIIFLMTTICTPVYAQELTAPSVPNDVQDLMPQDTQSFGEGLWYVISSGIRAFQPEIASGVTPSYRCTSSKGSLSTTSDS